MIESPLIGLEQHPSYSELLSNVAKAITIMMWQFPPGTLPEAIQWTTDDCPLGTGKFISKTVSDARSFCEVNHTPDGVVLSLK